MTSCSISEHGLSMFESPGCKYTGVFFQFGPMNFSFLEICGLAPRKNPVIIPGKPLDLMVKTCGVVFPVKAGASAGSSPRSFPSFSPTSFDCPVGSNVGCPTASRSSEGTEEIEVNIWFNQPKICMWIMDIR